MHKDKLIQDTRYQIIRWHRLKWYQDILLVGLGILGSYLIVQAINLFGTKSGQAFDFYHLSQSYHDTTAGGISLLIFLSLIIIIFLFLIIPMFFVLHGIAIDIEDSKLISVYWIIFKKEGWMKQISLENLKSIHYIAFEDSDMYYFSYNDGSKAEMEIQSKSSIDIMSKLHASTQIEIEIKRFNDTSKYFPKDYDITIKN